MLEILLERNLGLLGGSIVRIHPFLKFSAICFSKKIFSDICPTDPAAPGQMREICPTVFFKMKVSFQADIRNERATVGYGGEEKIFVGPAVHTCFVLCRKAKPGCTID